MRLATPDLAHEVGDTSRDAFARAGGIGLARRAEARPGLRETEIKSLLDRVGVLGLEARNGLDELLAAGEVCRAAGAVALPYPIVSMLASPPGFLGLVPLQQSGLRADHGELLREGVALVIGGSHHLIDSVDVVHLGRLAPFVAGVHAGKSVETETETTRDLALWFVLSAWWVLGATERALELTVKHVNERDQFGAPLARLQSVRFRVADVAVLTRGLAELSRYTVWRLVHHPQDALVDSLALRATAQEAAQTTFRTAHQLHGATGFTDEHDLSILSRHVQPYLRLPLDYEMTSALLAEQMDNDGFEGIFGRHR